LPAGVTADDFFIRAFSATVRSLILSVSVRIESGEAPASVTPLGFQPSARKPG
jgi:hypothetical protein